MSIELNRVLSATFVSALAVVIQIFLLSNLSRLNPEFTGYFGIAETILALIPVIICLGGDVYFQYRANNVNEVSSFLRSYLNYTWALFGLSVGPVVIIFYALLGQDGLLTSVCLVVYGNAFLTCINAYFLRYRLEIVYSSLVERSFYLINCVFLLPLLFVIDNEALNEAFYYVCMVCAVVSILGNFAIYRSIVKAIPKGGTTTGIRFFAADVRLRYFAATSVLIFVYERFDQLYILTRFDMDLLGYYFACYKICFITRYITSTFYMQAFPYFAKASNLSKNYYNQLLVATVAVSSLLLMPVLFYPKELLQLVYGLEFTKYSDVLVVLAVSTAISSVNQMKATLLNASGESRFIFFNSTLTVFVQVGIIISYATDHAIVTLAVSRLVATVIGYFLLSARLKMIRSKDGFL